MDERGTRWEDLIAHLTRTTTLPSSIAERLVAEVAAYFGETAEAFIKRRHRELQADGLTNAEIFERIAVELAMRPVAAPTFTERQIRRVIYG